LADGHIVVCAGHGEGRHIHRSALSDIGGIVRPIHGDHAFIHRPRLGDQSGLTGARLRHGGDQIIAGLVDIGAVIRSADILRDGGGVAISDLLHKYGASIAVLRHGDGVVAAGCKKTALVHVRIVEVTALGDREGGIVVEQLVALRIVEVTALGDREGGIVAEELVDVTRIVVVTALGDREGGIVAVVLADLKRIVVVTAWGDREGGIVAVDLVALRKVVVTALGDREGGIVVADLVALRIVVVTALGDREGGIVAGDLAYKFRFVVVTALGDREGGIVAIDLVDIKRIVVVTALGDREGGIAATLVDIRIVVVTALGDREGGIVAVELVDIKRTVGVTALGDRKGGIAAAVLPDRSRFVAVTALGDECARPGPGAILLNVHIIIVTRLDHRGHRINRVRLLGDLGGAARAGLRHQGRAEIAAIARAILLDRGAVARPAAGIFLRHFGDHAAAVRALGDGHLIVAGLINKRRAARAALRDGRLVGVTVRAGRRAVLIHGGGIAAARLVDAELVAVPGQCRGAGIALRHSRRGHRRGH